MNPDAPQEHPNAAACRTLLQLHRPRPRPPLWRVRVAALLLAGSAAGCALAQPASPGTRLRVVGGLAALNQFTRHEEPFWARELARLSGGRYGADIVPFDRAGIRAAEMLSLMKLGTVPFGTALLSQGSPRDLELGAPDLPGLNPDMATLRRHVAAFRPHLEQVLRERHGVELLAVYVYPAQVLFCNQSFDSLGAIKGRRVRTSGPAQSDWVEALGAQPVTTPFADIVNNLRAGNIDCAITGTMSGHTIGLHEHTSHLHGMAVTWGLSVFAAHGATWQALPADLKALLQRELPKLEQAVWAESERETREGISCSTGGADCAQGRLGRMTEVRPTAADERRRREILAGTVLPRWLQRCGLACAEVWNRTLAPATGLQAAAPAAASPPAPAPAPAPARAR